MKQKEEMRSVETKPEWKWRQKYKMFISRLMRQTTLQENGNYNLTVIDWRCCCCCCCCTLPFQAVLLLGPPSSRIQQLTEAQAQATGGHPWGEGVPSLLGSRPCPEPLLALPCHLFPAHSSSLAPLRTWGFLSITHSHGIFTAFAISTYHLYLLFLNYFFL